MKEGSGVGTKQATAPNMSKKLIRCQLTIIYLIDY